MLSVVITHYRSPELLRDCLAAVNQATCGLDAEVVVCDSAAVPGVAELVAAAGAQYVGFADNVGYARLVNAGMLTSHGELLLVLNADVRITRASLEGMMHRLNARQDVGAVGPHLVGPQGEHQPSAFRFYRPATVLARRTPFGRTRWGRRLLADFLMDDVMPAARGPVEVGWLMGACFLTRRRDVVEVGPLDPSYFMYFEDVDWFRRLWQAGRRVEWLPMVEVVHVHGRASHSDGVLASLANPYTRAHIASAGRYFATHGLRVPEHAP